MAISVASTGPSELDNILKHDADKGATVHSFDPAASPAEKGAAAGKSRDQLKSVIDHPVPGERGSLVVNLRVSKCTY